MKKFLIALVVLLSFGPLSAQEIETGYRGFVDVGYNLSVSKVQIGSYQADISNSIALRTSHGYQVVADYFFVGAGVGVEYWHEGTAWSVPVFADFRSDFARFGRSSIFIDAQVGYRFADVEGLTFNPQIGYRVGLSEKVGINVGVGYDLYTVKDISGTGGSISFKVGVDF